MSPNDLLHAWYPFYSLLGAASATMVGLLFVAASVGSGVFTSGRRAALRTFLSASVVNFGLTLASSLIVLAPLPNGQWLGTMILLCGLFGLAHASLAWRDTLKEGLIRSIDFEDRVWYLALPILGYLGVAASGVLFALEPAAGCTALAISVAALLGIAVHNAWDITLWIITRRRE
ncbi:MAG TPA: hypothetical protein VME47_16940 [Acetobacteraceae bacterium]|nr:hypothetical protein [Acetobacteraceae bacterium]